MYRTFLFLLVVGVNCAIKAQKPKLNSLPSATPVLYLDFDGQRIAGTQWNTTYTNGSAIQAQAPSLTDAQIIEIHNRISEDYRPFEINVTTDSMVYKSAPANKRCWLVFTTSSTWYPNSAGGVAYINVFASTSSTRKVGWVFTHKLSNSPASIAVAGSHEAGHQFGLQHQSEYNSNCELVSEYHAGTGSGQESWGPIMGAPYSKNQTIWHSGTIKTSCSTIQNDLSILTSINNLRYRNDDHGNTVASSTLLALDNGAFASQGLISTPSDIDVFTLKIVKPSFLNLNVVPYHVATGNRGANLNIKLRLNDEGDHTLFGDSASTNLEGTLTNIFLQSGTYYVTVDGDRSVYASDYGSLGSYTLSGSLVAQTTTGIAHRQWGSEIAVYPNPAHAQVTVDLGPRYQMVARAELLDLHGNLLLHIPFPGTRQATVDLQHVAKGMYFVRIVTADDVLLKQLSLE